MHNSILFVHGLQGHPKQTWSFHGQDIDEANRPESARSSRFNKLFKRRARIPATNSETKIQNDTARSSTDSPGVYWPADLLPSDAPNSRILTWGYDSWVTKGYGNTSRNNIFSHARDLIFEYSRNRPKDRKVIFVVHSLGGLVVKEVC